MGIGLLHVRRRTCQNWRPIVTKFGTLIENMNRTGQYDCHIFLDFVDDFMRKNSNFGIGVLHVKVKYWRIVCDVISLLAPVSIVSSNRVSKEVSRTKNWNFSMAQFLWYDCTFKKQYTVPMTLIFEGQFILVNLVQPYKYPVWISDRYLF